MRHLLIIETRDAAEHHGPADTAGLARAMNRSGVASTIFLTENGAFNARRGGPCLFDAAISEGVEVQVDGSALSERAIAAEALSAGIGVSDIAIIVDHLTNGSQVMWR